MATTLIVLAHPEPCSFNGARAASDVGEFGVCRLFVEDSQEFHASAAEELALLPERSAIAEMMAELRCDAR